MRLAKCTYIGLATTPQTPGFLFDGDDGEMTRRAKSTARSLKEYARGLAGGLLFSFPLLYTMEVWQAGFIATPRSLLMLLGFTFLLLLGYNRYSGMHPDASWSEIVADAIEELGLGLIISFTVLLMLNRIQLWDMSVNEIMGKVVIESMAVAIGVSVGTAQLGADEEEEGKKPVDDPRRTSKYSIAVLGLCGSVIIAGNVAPTEEISIIAMESRPSDVLIMSLISLTLSAIVVFFSDFKGSLRNLQGNFSYHLFFDTTLCYVISLIASAFMLWFFGRFDDNGFWICFSQTIVLGVLASLGASAGRLLIR